MDLLNCPSNEADAGFATVCSGCSGKNICQTQKGGLLPEDLQKLQMRMKVVKKKVLVLSGKGGVGKSTVSTLLALALAHPAEGEGEKVGVLDIDVCGPSVPQLLGVSDQHVTQSVYGWNPLKSPKCNVKVMSAGCLLQSANQAVAFRGPRKSQLIKQLLSNTVWGKLDTLLVDTPPGTSDEHLSIVKLLQSVGELPVAVLVTTPQDVAMGVTRRQVTFCRQMNLRILGVIENMSGFVCPCCQVLFTAVDITMVMYVPVEVTEIFSSSNSSRLYDELDLTLLTRIPMDQNVASLTEDPNFLSNHQSSPVVQAISKVIHQYLLLDKV